MKSETLPEVAFRSLTPSKRDSFEWWIGATPRWAPMNFRDLPPSEDVDHSKSRCREGCCYTVETVGSGVPAAEIALRSSVSRCLACASDDTRIIHRLHECTYYRREYESVHHERVEYVCTACANFSSYSNRWTE